VSVLYVSYDGLTEPIGQSQVVAYVTRLSARGHRITLVSFEKPEATRAEIAACAATLARAGVRWIRLAYHRRPTVPATAFDMSAGVLAGLAARVRGPIRVVHGRSYVASMMCWALRPVTGARFVFDMRNFWADEKVEAGAWPAGGGLFRAVKDMERRFLRAADHVVTLTARARAEVEGLDYLAGRVPPVSVIPTCVDLALFRRAADAAPPGDAPLVVYSGSLGGRYLGAEVGRLFAAIRRRAPGARLQIWTRQDPRPIVEAAAGAGAPRDCITAAVGARDDVARALARAHIGLSMLSDAWVNCGSMPTKMGEYLAAGVVLATSPGVGDMDALLAGARAGVSLPSATPADAELDAAAQAALALAADPGTPARARAVAEKVFALDAGVEQYDAIYRSLGA